MIKANCKKNHCSSTSRSARCDLKNKGDILKIHGCYSNPRCKCQKQFTFTPQQFQMEGAGFENTMKKKLKELRKCETISLDRD